MDLNNSQMLKDLEFEDHSSAMAGSELIFWSTVFILEALFIVLGNFLTMLTFLNFKLRQNKPYFFLLNLSLADFIVGAFSIPLFVHVFIFFFSGRFIKETIFASHIFVEVFTEFLAIFSLALVSLERMYAVVWPLKHRRAQIRSYMICIIFTWVLAAVVPCLAHIPHEITRKLSFYLYFIFHTTALVVICISYMMVWFWVTCHRPAIISRHHELDRKLARTLVLVTVVSLITWLPFQIIYYFENLCGTCGMVPNTPLYFSKMMHYGNSLVNPVLYCFRIPEFYHTTLRVLKPRSRRGGGHTNNSLELRRQNGADSLLPMHLNSLVQSKAEQPMLHKSLETCLDA